MLLKVQKYMNAKDALAAIEDVEKLNERERKEDDRRGRKKGVDRSLEYWQEQMERW